MPGFLNRLFTPERDNLVDVPDRDWDVAYLAYLRDANPFGMFCR